MNKHPILFLIGGIFSLMIAMGIGRFAYTPILPLMQNALSLLMQWRATLLQAIMQGIWLEQY